jgi:hypothetical protein
MTQFTSLSYSISKFIHEISIRCYNLELDSAIKKELSCAKTILIALNSSNDILALLSTMHRQDLSDTIITHGKRYLEEYKKYPELEDETLIFQNSLDEFVKKISVIDKNKFIPETSEINILSENFYTILKKIQIFFSNQSQNKNSLEFIHALSIVYKIGDRPFQEHIVLTELLLLIKELWNIEYVANKFKEAIIVNRFYLNPIQLLQIDEDDLDIEKIFSLTIDKLTSKENSVLLHLEDEKILSLYDRLKNYEGYKITIFSLLEKIHEEAQFRYSYHRLSDTGYQLLSRFQSFDAMKHQIENLEFSILEAYLFKKSNFTKEILVNIAKHSHNIKALCLNKNENFLKIISHIGKKLNNQSEGKDGSLAMLYSLKNGLNNLLPSYVKKRYSELDKFHNIALQKRYSNVFMNIISIFEDTDNSNKFLQNILTYRLASDYYLPHLSNSIDKLRTQAIERKKVISLLSDLDFIIIFSPGNFNHLDSFNFIKNDKIVELKTPIEYVKSLIDNMCININAFQLYTLYRAVSCLPKLTPSQIMLIDSIKTQIKQRMTIRKLLYSMFSGKKKEYDKLKILKKIFAES